VTADEIKRLRELHELSKRWNDTHYEIRAAIPALLDAAEENARLREALRDAKRFLTGLPAILEDHPQANSLQLPQHAKVVLATVRAALEGRP
jgi:hypothetical protein